MNQQDHFFHDQIWQFIGTFLSFVLGVLGLLVAIFALPEPGRNICIASSIIFIGFALIGIYIIVIHARIKRSLYWWEKVGSGGCHSDCCVAMGSSLVCSQKLAS